MIDISVLFNQLIKLFIVMCIGYTAYKLHYFDDRTNKQLNKFIVNITLPLTIISSVLEMTNRPAGSTIGFVFLISVLLYAALPIVSIFIVKIMRFPKSEQGLYMFMLIFSNVGFMGFPILQTVFGENGSTAVFYGAILNIIFNLSAFTYGIIIIGYGSTLEASISLKSLLTPGISCSILSIIIYALDIHFPDPIEGSIEMMGSLTSPMAMLLIGSTLASMPLKEIFDDRRVYVFTFVKLIITPLILYPFLKHFIKDELIFGVILIEILMPVANTSLIFATEYDLDTKLSSKTIFITTALSLITIPLMLSLLS